MSYQFPEIRKFDGLYLQANSYDVPDGALEIAQNVEIQSDGVLQKTRGWYTYWVPPSEIRAIVRFQNRLLAFGSFGIVVFFDEIFDPESPTGNPTSISSFSINEYTARFQEQNQNLYFTARSGITKLESAFSNALPAGVPPGLDLLSRAGNSATGPLPANSQTGYRIQFGRRDTNGNLLLGAPSDVSYVAVLDDLAGVSYSALGAGPYVVTVTLPGSNAGWITGQKIIVSSGTSANVNGTQTIRIVAPSANTITFDVAANPGLAGTLNISFSRDAYFEASIPSEIDNASLNWFYQVYRSSSSVGLDVAPAPDFKLVAETNLTASDLSLGFITFIDDVDLLFVGAQLYTNPNSREGELQANARPPKATDIQLYKGYMLYANITTRQRLSLQMLDAFSFSGQSLTFRLLSTDETYVGKTLGPVNQTVSASAVSGTSTITITYAGHGASNGWTVELVSVTGSVPRGTYVVSGVTLNTFNISSSGNSATAIDFYFVTNGTNPIFFVDGASTSPSEQIENTCFYLVKAINRYSALIYANYASTFDDPPGRISFESKFFESDLIYVKIDDRFRQPFITRLPDSFSTGVQVYFENDRLPNVIAVSKQGEPEAVPVLQNFPAGSANAEILRIFTLRDSVIIIKEDGIFRLSGDTIDQFQITAIDSTVFGISLMGADRINNFVHAITNQGIVAISESSVRIISRRIDDPIQFNVSMRPGSLNNALVFCHETARTCFVSFERSLTDQPDVTYLYNVLNESWFETPRVFRNMCTGPNDVAYGVLGNEANILVRQRKGRNLVDYSDEFATISVIATGALTATMTFTALAGTIFVPSPGDMIVYDTSINRIASVVTVGGSYELTFQAGTNIPNDRLVGAVLYQGFLSVIKFAPFHAGQVGREKFFAQLQLHLRQPVISNLSISFTTESFPGFEETNWEKIVVTGISTGWGYEPWGLFPWGLSEKTDLKFGTYPSIIIRTLMPSFAARSTWIQPTFEHRQAGEPMLIQALTYCVRGYGERVSK